MSAINRSILWKLIITALVIIWAISAMVPFSDTPFEIYIQTRATAHQDEFAKILKAAEARVDKAAAKGDKTKSPTLYIALLRRRRECRPLQIFSGRKRFRHSQS